MADCYAVVRFIQKFLCSNISQGSVATHLRCGRIFIIALREIVGERIVKIGCHLTKLEAKVVSELFNVPLHWRVGDDLTNVWVKGWHAWEQSNFLWNISDRFWDIGFPLLGDRL